MFNIIYNIMVMTGVEFDFVGKYNNGTLESGIPFIYKGKKYKIGG